ncbi:hypothetical protein ACGE24_03925 [Corynebacterium kroppenstedtii]|uniref:hypothetical protein n=1 Tax=Corynebacterium sp. PCR 32 TaxID=3351342 RepID=UPI0030B2AA35
MAKFKLEDYESVDERIQRFYRDNKNGRIETDLIAFDGKHKATRWIVKASVFKAPEEPVSGVGHAFEIDGTGMANNTSALENAETSAVGRALAQAGYSGSRRTTREEMAKVLLPELRERIAKATSKDETREIWNEANKNGLLNEVKQAILDRNEKIVNGEK